MPKWTALIQNLPHQHLLPIAMMLEEEYEDIVHSSSGVLLSPSVPPLSEEQSSSLIANIIKEARNDRDRAIMELPRLSRENKEGKERTGMHKRRR